MNYSGIINCSIVDGVGFRTTLFISGCNHCCEGCQNPHTWDFNAGRPYTEEVEKILFDRISEIYNFKEFELADIRQIIEELSQVEITKEVTSIIYNKSKSFRKIVECIDALEQVASANSLNVIDGKIAQEVLNG